LNVQINVPQIHFCLKTNVFIHYRDVFNMTPILNVYPAQAIFNLLISTQISIHAHKILL